MGIQQANRWWLHLYRLLTGEWGEDLRSSNPLNQAPSTEGSAPGTTPAAAADGVSPGFPSPDWPSARRIFPNWLWLGLVSEKRAIAKTTNSGDVLATAEFDHARGKGLGYVPPLFDLDVITGISSGGPASTGLNTAFKSLFIVLSFPRYSGGSSPI